MVIKRGKKRRQLMGSGCGKEREQGHKINGK